MIKCLKENSAIFFIFSFSQLCSIRYFLNSSFFNQDINFFYLYVILSCVLFYILVSKKIINFFLNDKFFYLVLLIFLSFLFYVYPIQENLKFNMQGSDQDNCYIDILNNIKNNEKNIYSTSYLGNPCSTGLLAFIFYFPLIIWKNYFIVIPVICLLLFKFSSQYLLRESRISNLLSLILLSNLVFLELSVSGSDFILISISYLVGNLLLIDGLKNKNNLKLIASFVFFLFFFGSRSILLILTIPLALVFYYQFTNKKVLIFFLSLFACVFLSFAIPYYLILPNVFPPFHLFSKAIWYLDNVKYILLPILLVSIFLKNIIIEVINKNFLLSILSIFIIPLFLSGISGFLYNINDLSKWEELNYLYICTPTLFTFLYAIFKKNLIK
jgi:hypothetical protein